MQLGLFILLFKVVLPFMSVDETLVCVTVQMKANEQYFHVVLFIILYKVVLTFKSVVTCDQAFFFRRSAKEKQRETRRSVGQSGFSQCVTIQMKATEQYFHVVLFIILYKVVLTFKSVDETLVCDHSNVSYRAVLSCEVVHYA